MRYFIGTIQSTMLSTVTMSCKYLPLLMTCLCNHHKGAQAWCHQAISLVACEHRGQTLWLATLLDWVHCCACMGGLNFWSFLMIGWKGFWSSIHCNDKILALHRTNKYRQSFELSKQWAYEECFLRLLMMIAACQSNTITILAQVPDISPAPTFRKAAQQANQEAKQS